MVKKIYPAELHFNKTNTIDTEASVLDLHLFTSLGENGILKADAKEKADICNWQFNSAFTRESDSDPPSKWAGPFSMGDITVDPKRVAKLLD